MSEQPVTAEDQREAVRKEYSQFVALQTIFHDGARAYNVGDAVPASNVEAHGYLTDGLVAKAGTKKAEAAAPEVSSSTK